MQYKFLKESALHELIESDSSLPSCRSDSRFFSKLKDEDGTWFFSTCPYDDEDDVVAAAMLRLENLLTGKCHLEGKSVPVITDLNDIPDVVPKSILQKASKNMTYYPNHSSTMMYYFVYKRGTFGEKTFVMPIFKIPDGIGITVSDVYRYIKQKAVSTPSISSKIEPN